MLHLKYHLLIPSQSFKMYKLQNSNLNFNNRKKKEDNTYELLFFKNRI